MREMLIDRCLNRVQDGAVDQDEGLAERHADGAQNRERHGGYQEDRGEHGQDTLGDHMNSFSFFLPSHIAATNAP
jgi:hypothetical protein